MNMEPNCFGQTSLSSSSPSSGVGLTALSLDTNQQGQGWQQLLPAGYFKAVDGRPHDVPGNQWFLDGSGAARLIAGAQSRVNDLVIDYEHQTLNSERNGQPAPAAGWFKSGIQWREGAGLWILPCWTPRALEFIKQGEYRYLSAVFTYNKATGTPESLHSAALVNRPGLDGMKAVEALKATRTMTQPSLGCAALSAEEEAAASRYGLSVAEYCVKRDAYCSQRLTDWASLSALSESDYRVMHLCGQQPDEFLKSKLSLLAEKIALDGAW